VVCFKTSLTKDLTMTPDEEREIDLPAMIARCLHCLAYPQISEVLPEGPSSSFKEHMEIH
jgi:hypothetical protein